jgi:hypothetical protein
VPAVIVLRMYSISMQGDSIVVHWIAAITILQA